MSLGPLRHGANHAAPGPVHDATCIRKSVTFELAPAVMMPGLDARGLYSTPSTEKCAWRVTLPCRTCSLPPSSQKVHMPRAPLVMSTSLDLELPKDPLVDYHHEDVSLVPHRSLGSGSLACDCLPPESCGHRRTASSGTSGRRLSACRSATLQCFPATREYDWAICFLSLIHISEPTRPY